jgi:hypothetical protein
MYSAVQICQTPSPPAPQKVLLPACRKPQACTLHLPENHQCATEWGLQPHYSVQSCSEPSEPAEQCWVLSLLPLQKIVVSAKLASQSSSKRTTPSPSHHEIHSRRIFSFRRVNRPAFITAGLVTGMDICLESSPAPGRGLPLTPPCLCNRI